MKGVFVLVAALIIWSIGSIVFAFVEPPAELRSLFRLPAVFALFGKKAAPVARIFGGAFGLTISALITWHIILAGRF